MFVRGRLAAVPRVADPSGCAGGHPPVLRPVTIPPVGLAFEDVSYAAQDGRVLVSNIDLTVAPGTRLAIVGPNGAGKTTLARLLCGSLAPSRGRVLIGGEPVGAMRPRRRALCIAMVFQTDHPDGRLTLRDYVGLGRVPHRGLVPEAAHTPAVAKALDRVGLTSLAARRLETLSGGERQRGAIARAIAQEPRLLLLDEPTNHLDPRARADVLALARDLGITVVAVLHDLALVTPFADSVAVLDRGRLVAHGPPAHALDRRTVRDVFAMDSFRARSPGSGRTVLVFDTP